MTQCAVYVGDLEDPGFQWEGGNWSDNIPKRISPEFPPMRGNYNGTYHAWIRENNIQCKITDFGGWVALVSKLEILKFIYWAYSDDEELPWVVNELPKIIGFIKTLPDDRKYGLIATEF